MKKYLWWILGVILIVVIVFSLYIFIPRNLKFEISIPHNPKFDYSNSENYIIVTNDDGLQITISNEYSPYEDVFEYIDFYHNRFYVNDDYLTGNKMTLNENRFTDINENKTQILSLTKDYDNLEDATYTYAYVKTSDRNYTRFMFKSNMKFNDEYVEMYENILKSYKPNTEHFRSKVIYYANKVVKKVFNVPNFFKEYKDVKTISVKATENPNWDEKTKELYNRFKNSDDVLWGLFIKGMHGNAINTTIPELEEKLESKFDIMLVYNHLGNELPTEAMEQMKKEDRIIEFTYQVCVNNNETLYGYTPMFDVIDRKYDEEIRKLANELKAFENPVLFRLNNEMNSDWTSYAGIICLSDPEIYKGVWRRIYDIFEEENVTNCIWVFNPNDNNYPPSEWNNFIAYYPGDKYVQMIGITGYNTGTYYAEKYGERWRTFKEIYDGIDAKYMRYFKDFPWIITEFACSSNGGDKAKWITDMFDDLKNHKNIKAAVWFSEADYNPENGEVARPYFLDETEETISAFRDGLKKK